jgi:nucleoside-diphosphate-sugar epimerase
VGHDQQEPVDLEYGVGRRPLDISRLRSDVGFTPAYELEAGLRASMPWWRAMLAAEGQLAKH